MGLHLDPPLLKAYQSSVLPDIPEVEKIEAACEDAKVELGYENGVQQVYLNGENITSQLREEAVGNMASVSSAVPAVRAKLLDLQRNLAKEKDVVMDG